MVIISACGGFYLSIHNNAHCNLPYILNRTVDTFCTVPSNEVEQTLPHRFDLSAAVPSRQL